MSHTEGIERLIGAAKRRADHLDQLAALTDDLATKALTSLDAAAWRILVDETTRELAALKRLKISTNEGVFAS